MEAGSERGPVIVEVNHANLEEFASAHIDAAPDLVRKAIRRCGVAAGATNCRIRARTAEESFRERRDVPRISDAEVVARPIVIPVEHVLRSADGLDVIAGVADDLNPGFDVPAEGSDAANQVGGGSAGAATIDQGQ